MGPSIGKIERRRLREVWPHEERDFTAWLRDNVDVLSDQLGFELVNAERERAAGTFSVDLVAETSDGRAVVVENQLERSDHDHLGKVLTYLASFDAKVAIWIVSEPRPEHVQAITWLNQANLVDFYMFKVEAVVIGDSAPAPLLTRIVGPSAESTAVGQTKKDFAERHDIRQRFWEAFLRAAVARGALRAGKAITTDNWMEKREGPFTWVWTIRGHETQVTLYVDGFAIDGNYAFLDRLRQSKAEIEAAFGVPLMWDLVNGRKHQKVVALLPGRGYRDEEEWSAVVHAMLEAMARLDAACRPHLDDATRAAGVPDGYLAGKTSVSGGGNDELV